MSCELFFIRGNAKSGTNWLCNLMNLHPMIRCKGEFQLQHLFVGFDKTLNAKWGLLSKNKDLLKDGFYSMIESIVFQYCDYYPLCCDRSPIGLCKTIMPGKKYLYITRDGRDVLVSWAFHAMRNNIVSFPEFQKNVDLFQKDPDYFEKNKHVLLNSRDIVRSIAMFWNQLIVDDFKLMQRVDAGEIPIQYLWIKYEALISNINVELDRIFAFLGVDPNLAKPLTERTQPGFDRIDNQSIYRRGATGAWSEYMTEEQLSWFMEDAAEGMRIIESSPYQGGEVSSNT
ncbi:MAG: sulfotransferase domain-containing protein [Saprospiraceae bacterium]|nr:sulfotransferase domain-containing protein [Saprospiraceae bacterium]